jgi:hypothetical protein
LAAAGPSGQAAADPLAHGRDQLRALYDGVERIERTLATVAGSATRSSCVAERLAEARIGARIADQELTEIKASLQRKDDPRAARARLYSQKRLDLLTQRAAEVERAAHVCADEDRSVIDVTQVLVEVAPLPEPEPGSAPATATSNTGTTAPQKPPAASP